MAVVQSVGQNRRVHFFRDNQIETPWGECPQQAAGNARFNQGKLSSSFLAGHAQRPGATVYDSIRGSLLRHACYITFGRQGNNMYKIHSLLLTAVFGALVAGCATVNEPPTRVEAPVSRAEQQTAQAEYPKPESPTLKRKIAIGRFTNETSYGQTLFRDKNLNPLGKQAADMLASRLVRSGRFLVFERPDIAVIKAEQTISGGNLVGVDTLIVGSVTELGRSVTGKAGFLSKTKKQTARAKVEARLVDVHTGLVYFAATGAGEASSVAGQIAGFGSKAAYDATLNGKAIGAAISDLVTNIMNRLKERKWRTDILDVKGDIVYISGGPAQGLKKGDIFDVMKKGKTVTSGQTGMKITLPGTQIARIKVLDFFGSTQYTQGSRTRLISGSLANHEPGELYVVAE